MRFAIADPPYPPHVTMRYDVPGGRVVTRSRARRYYGDGTRSAGEKPADFHHAAGEWDDPGRHRELLELLHAEFDGWAIATTPDGIAAYGTLPIDTRLLAWIQPNAQPGGGRIRRSWEAVIAYTPALRRGRGTGWPIPDTLTASHPTGGFVGAKPAAWTRWVLDVLGFNPDLDTLADLFPGSGAVTHHSAYLPLEPS